NPPVNQYNNRCNNPPVNQNNDNSSQTKQHPLRDLLSQVGREIISNIAPHTVIDIGTKLISQRSKSCSDNNFVKNFNKDYDSLQKQVDSEMKKMKKQLKKMHKF
ncbi:MAG: hypothetical protein K2H26_00995, partial [Ruminococcus sp.]|nr:hypothetical protein [Ruminococcus sp.]